MIKRDFAFSALCPYSDNKSLVSPLVLKKFDKLIFLNKYLNTPKERKNFNFFLLKIKFMIFNKDSFFNSISIQSSSILKRLKAFEIMFGKSWFKIQAIENNT